MCYFARDKKKWGDLFTRDSAAVMSRTTKKVYFTILDNISDLEKLMSVHDVLYVSGGEAENLEPYYEKFINLKRMLDGKTYIGSSMGSFMASANYVLSLDSQDTSTVHKGLGILPINCLCHFDVETEKERKIELLQSEFPQLPILTLDESRFATFIL
jgi:peptidase E